MQYSGHPKPRVGVSRCLLEESVCCDRGHGPNRFFTEVLNAFVEWVALWPGDEIEPGVPREDLATLDGVVLTNDHPNCGLDGLPVFFNGNRVHDEAGGVWFQHLTELTPHLATEEEQRLSNVDQCEHFVERIFGHARLREMFASHWRARDLVAFHTRHKLQLMAHSPQAYRALGQITARAGAEEGDELERQYRARFHHTLALPSTPGRHVNVLQHAFGMVSDLLDDTRRGDFLATVQSYQAGKVPLAVPVSLIRHYCTTAGVTWAAQQTYLAPFPPELGLGHALRSD